MKTLWNIISVMAVANLVALGGIVGWLKLSDRLSVERLRAVREALSTTLTDDAAAAAVQVAALEQAQKDQEAAAKAARPPLTAAEKLAARVEATEHDRQRLDRLKREVQDLQAALARERAELDGRQTRLTADQKDFDEQVSQVGEIAGAEQFQKTLGLLQSLKPADASSLLLEIMSGRAGPASGPAMPAGPEMGANASASIEPAGGESRRVNEGRTVVVEYLNAMDERARTKVMTEFAKSDPALAAQLLESLRKRGQFARVDAGTSP